MGSAPFEHRIVALSVFLALVSGIELAVRGDRAVRWRASLLILILAVAGAGLGALVDLVTSSVSPDYFAVGKGLGWESGLVSRACALGVRAGAVGGVVVGGVFAWVGYGGARPAPAFSRVLRQAPVCALAAVLCGLSLGALAALFPPSPLLDVVRPAVGPGRASTFVVVWLAHVGVYLGAAWGTVRGALRIRRMRRE